MDPGILGAGGNCALGTEFRCQGAWISFGDGFLCQVKQSEPHVYHVCSDVSP